MGKPNSTSGAPWNGTKMTFTKIAERLGVSRQCVTHTHKRMLNKLEIELAKDPEIRDWLIEQGYQVPQPKDKENDQ